MHKNDKIYNFLSVKKRIGFGPSGILDKIDNLDNFLSVKTPAKAAPVRFPLDGTLAVR